MKKSIHVLLAASALSIPSLSSAAAVYTFEGTINTLYSYTDQPNYYSDAGVSPGGHIQFKVLLDFSRQGQQTNADGSTTVFQDEPVVRDCEFCGLHGTWYDYAELIYSSVDFSIDLPANRPSRNYAGSYKADSQNGPHDIGAVRLGYDLEISSGDWSGWITAYVYNWEVTTSHYYYTAAFSLNDGVGGKIQAYSDQLRLVSINEIPIPAAAWLMGSGLMALGGIARRRVQQS